MTRYDIALGRKIKRGKKKSVKIVPSIHCSICPIDAVCNDYYDCVYPVFFLGFDEGKKSVNWGKKRR